MVAIYAPFTILNLDNYGDYSFQTMRTVQTAPSASSHGTAANATDYMSGEKNNQLAPVSSFGPWRALDSDAVKLDSPRAIRGQLFKMFES